MSIRKGSISKSWFVHRMEHLQLAKETGKLRCLWEYMLRENSTLQTEEHAYFL